jgi:hypothetical protein
VVEQVQEALLELQVMAVQAVVELFHLTLVAQEHQVKVMQAEQAEQVAHLIMVQAVVVERQQLVETELQQQAEMVEMVLHLL